AGQIIEEFESYTEISPTGTGPKIFVQAVLPPGRNRRGLVEIYDRGRFFTVTGQLLPQTRGSIEERQAQLEKLQRNWTEAPTSCANGKPRSAPQNWAELSDEQLIAKAKAAHNGEKFSQLWAGNTVGYDSQSEADLALCNLLAFYTGPDAARIDRLF